MGSRIATTSRQKEHRPPSNLVYGRPEENSGVCRPQVISPRRGFKESEGAALDSLANGLLKSYMLKTCLEDIALLVIRSPLYTYVRVLIFGYNK